MPAQGSCAVLCCDWNQGDDGGVGSLTQAPPPRPSNEEPSSLSSEVVPQIVELCKPARALDFNGLGLSHTFSIKQSSFKYTKP